MGPDDSLRSAQRKFKSSHDAVMVVDEKGTLLGVVSPYYALLHRQFPPDTKLKHALLHPPHITEATPLVEIIRLILESKIHFLPVVDESEKIIGIVSARRILQQIEKLPRAGDAITTLTDGKHYLQTITVGSKATELSDFFKRTKYSKIIIVDEHNHLKGIVSAFDVMEGREQGKVEEYMKKHVITVGAQATVATVVHTMLAKEIGSVVVVKPGNVPTQIITTSDLLKWAIT